jgi:hypothetical protein
MYVPTRAASDAGGDRPAGQKYNPCLSLLLLFLYNQATVLVLDERDLEV